MQIVSRRFTSAAFIFIYAGRKQKKMGILQQYKDLKEKEESFEVKRIRTKKDFDILFNVLSKRDSDSIWRGMSESKFKHYTSLQRFWIQNDLENEHEEVEKYLRHIFNYARFWNSDFFTKYYNNYGISSFPIFSALSILRHHGTPTPLIDWTRNPLVGLFFGASSTVSCESSNDIDNYFSFYEMKSTHPYYQYDSKEISYQFWKNQEEQLRELNKEHEDDPEFIDKFFQGYLMQENLFFESIKNFPVARMQDLPDDKFKYHINNNYNITNQEGLFVMNVHPNKPLEEVIIGRVKEMGVKKGHPESDIKTALNRHKPNFISYDIHKSLKPYVLRKIHEEGINESYIYPDLKKLAEDCVKSYLMT